MALEADVYEIKLGEHFLMTSHFTGSEVALAELGLAACEGEALDVVVGGLGLGYTARSVLHSARVRSMLVVELLEPVIEWHERELVPLGRELTSDPRCRFACGDFFALAASEHGFAPEAAGSRFHAVLLDIDHSLDQLLDAGGAMFYEPPGLHRLARHLHPGGVFGLWSNGEPEPDFVMRLAEVFAEARAEPVTFRNPLVDGPVTQTVHLGKKR